MSVLSTLLVDGVDIRSLAGIIVTRMDLSAPGTRRGSADTIPGRQGQLGARLPYDAYVFAVTITVIGASEAEYVTRLAAVGAAVAGDSGLVALARRLPTSGGGYVQHTANGQFAGGLSFDLLNPVSGETELSFINLSGAWWNGSTWLVP